MAKISFVQTKKGIIIRGAMEALKENIEKYPTYADLAKSMKWIIT